MIRLSISVALAFAVAMSAEAMLPVPLHEPDAMITQVRKARQCERLTQSVRSATGRQPAFVIRPALF